MKQAAVPSARRRALVIPCVLVLGAIAIAACTSSNDGSSTSKTTRTPGTVIDGVPNAQSSLPAGSPLQDPPELVSKDGVLQASLTVNRTKYNVAGQIVEGMTYNGLLQPPTLKVNPGDRIELSLTNQLGDAAQAARETGTTITPAQAMSGLTNLHYHGFDVSPSGDSDNIFLEVPTGKTQNYKIQLPADHEQGMYWYHPHIHLNSEQQVLGGMSGFIQVGSPSSQLPPELDGIKTRYLALKDLPALPQPVTPPGSPNQAQIPLDGLRVINGQVQPTIDIAPGEVQLWRFGNIGADVPYSITMGDATFYVINQDGVRQPAMTPETTLAIPPGKRFDVLVTGPPAGQVDLMTNTIPFGGSTVPAYKLATVSSTGDPVTPTTLPLPLKNGKGPIDAPATVQRNFTLGYDPTTNQFLINGKAFDPQRIDTVVRGGDTEEWTIINSTPLGHPFHIHVTDFQVLTVNGQEQPFQGQMDTVFVPPNQTVVFKITFDKRFPGKFVYHCHILNHEDGGMMGVIEVVAPDATATTTPGTALKSPGTTPGTTPGATNGGGTTEGTSPNPSIDPGATPTTATAPT